MRPQKAKPKADLFAVIKMIDRRDLGYIDIVSKEDREDIDKALSYPLLRWISATEDQSTHEYYVMAVNEMVNPFYFGLGKHRELQYKLLAVAGCGGWAKHKWLPPLKSSKKSTKAVEFLLGAIEDITLEDAELWLEMNGQSGLDELMRAHGVQEKDRKEVIRASF